MYEPGLDRHEWESELAALEDDLRDDPAAALPELDDLVARMLAETGYDIGDPVVRAGEERELVAEFLAARELKDAYERGSDELSAGDVGAAINGYRAIYDYLVENRAAADSAVTQAGEPEA
jgi:hypothetical protein